MAPRPTGPTDLVFHPSLRHDTRRGCDGSEPTMPRESPDRAAAFVVSRSSMSAWSPSKIGAGSGRCAELLGEQVYRRVGPGCDPASPKLADSPRQFQRA
jgi:hypothetical protein